MNGGRYFPFRFRSLLFFAPFASFADNKAFARNLSR